MRVKEREADILRTIMDGLSAMRIFHLRMNTATTILSYKGKKRAIRQGRKGMADILVLKAYQVDNTYVVNWLFRPIWLEVKRPEGSKQRIEQMNFQAEVEAEGHVYKVVHSWEETLKVLQEIQ